MTTISLDALKIIYAQETGHYPILLVTMSHPGLTDDVRLSTDPTTRLPSLTTDEQVVYGTVSNSAEYVYVPMSLKLPTDEEEAAPQTQLICSNVGRELVEVIRSLSYSPSVTIDLYFSDNTDRREWHFSDFKFSEVDINTMTVSGTLTLDMLTNEPFPFRTFTPSTAAGLFTL